MSKTVVFAGNQPSDRALVWKRHRKGSALAILALAFFSCVLFCHAALAQTLPAAPPPAAPPPVTTSPAPSPFPQGTIQLPSTFITLTPLEAAYEFPQPTLTDLLNAVNGDPNAIAEFNSLASAPVVDGSGNAVACPANPPAGTACLPCPPSLSTTPCTGIYTQYDGAALINQIVTYLGGTATAVATITAATGTDPVAAYAALEKIQAVMLSNNFFESLGRKPTYITQVQEDPPPKGDGKLHSVALPTGQNVLVTGLAYMVGGSGNTALMTMAAATDPTDPGNAAATATLAVILSYPPVPQKTASNQAACSACNQACEDSCSDKAVDSPCTASCITAACNTAIPPATVDICHSTVAVVPWAQCITGTPCDNDQSGNFFSVLKSSLKVGCSMETTGQPPLPLDHCEDQPSQLIKAALGIIPTNDNGMIAQIVVKQAIEDYLNGVDAPPPPDPNSKHYPGGATYCVDKSQSCAYVGPNAISYLNGAQAVLPGGSLCTPPSSPDANVCTDQTTTAADGHTIAKCCIIKPVDNPPGTPANPGPTGATDAGGGDTGLPYIPAANGDNNWGDNVHVDKDGKPKKSPMDAFKVKTPCSLVGIKPSVYAPLHGMPLVSFSFGVSISDAINTGLGTDAATVLQQVAYWSGKLGDVMTDWNAALPQIQTAVNAGSCFVNTGSYVDAANAVVNIANDLQDAAADIENGLNDDGTVNTHLSLSGSVGIGGWGFDPDPCLMMSGGHNGIQATGGISASTGGPAGPDGVTTNGGVTKSNPDGSSTTTSTSSNPDGSSVTTATKTAPDGTATTTITTTAPDGTQTVTTSSGAASAANPGSTIISNGTGVSQQGAGASGACDPNAPAPSPFPPGQPVPIDPSTGQCPPGSIGGGQGGSRPTQAIEWNAISGGPGSAIFLIVWPSAPGQPVTIYPPGGQGPPSVISQEQITDNMQSIIIPGNNGVVTIPPPAAGWGSRQGCPKGFTCEDCPPAMASACAPPPSIVCWPDSSGLTTNNGCAFGTGGGGGGAGNGGSTGTPLKDAHGNYIPSLTRNTRGLDFAQNYQGGEQWAKWFPGWVKDQWMPALKNLTLEMRASIANQTRQTGSTYDSLDTSKAAIGMQKHELDQIVAHTPSEQACVAASPATGESFAQSATHSMTHAFEHDLSKRAGTGHITTFGAGAANPPPAGTPQQPAGIVATVQKEEFDEYCNLFRDSTANDGTDVCPPDADVAKAVNSDIDVEGVMFRDTIDLGQPEQAAAAAAIIRHIVEPRLSEKVDQSVIDTPAAHKLILTVQHIKAARNIAAAAVAGIISRRMAMTYPPPPPNPPPSPPVNPVGGGGTTPNAPPVNTDIPDVGTTGKKFTDFLYQLSGREGSHNYAIVTHPFKKKCPPSSPGCAHEGETVYGNYYGTYQTGEAILRGINCVQPDNDSNNNDYGAGTSGGLYTDRASIEGKWTGSCGGVNSNKDWLNNDPKRKPAQDSAATAALKKVWNALKNSSTVTNTLCKTFTLNDGRSAFITPSAVLAGSWLIGPGSTTSGKGVIGILSTGKDKTDGNGSSAFKRLMGGFGGYALPADWGAPDCSGAVATAQATPPPKPGSETPPAPGVSDPPKHQPAQGDAPLPDPVQPLGPPKPVEQVVKEIRMKAGVPENKISDKPSYNEVMLAMTKERFLNPDYYVRTADDVGAIQQEQTAIDAYITIQLKDIYDLQEQINALLAARESLKLNDPAHEQDSYAQHTSVGK